MSNSYNSKDSQGNESNNFENENLPLHSSRASEETRAHERVPTENTAQTSVLPTSEPTEPLNFDFDTINVGKPQTFHAEERAPKAKARMGSLVLSALLGGAIATGGNIAYERSKSPAATYQASDNKTNTVIVNDASKVNTTSAVVQKALPSVVTIGAESQSVGSGGSGIVIDDQGHILTNNHVVTADGKISNPSLQVRDSNGKVYVAKIVGTDPVSDLAVLKIENATLPSITFGNSSKLNVGQEAVAIGAPLGLSESVTEGIISALNRSILVQSSAAPTQDSEQSEQGGQGQQNEQFKFALPEGSAEQGSRKTVALNVLQTDAPINQGNSGGALLDTEGKLIGINVAIAPAAGSSGGGGNIGIGFAIPADYAHRIATELIAKGKASHGFIGVNLKSKAADVGQSRTTFSVGAVIDSVVDGSPMAKADFKKGDVITKFGTYVIGDASNLTAAVKEAVPGTEVEVMFKRGDQDQKATVTVGESK